MPSGLTVRAVCGFLLGLGLVLACPAEAVAQSVKFTLTVEGLGLTQLPPWITDIGLVTSSPAGISCRPTCSASFPAGTVVTLTARSQNGFTFFEWSGGICSGTGPCVVTMNADKTVRADYGVVLPATPDIFSLGVAVVGHGSVTSNPAGINCGSVCTAPYNGGGGVVLTPTAENGWTFTGWSGACSGITSPTTWPVPGTCVVTMFANQSVTATFTADSFPLGVTVLGSGSVTSSPPGINCGAACSASFPSGTTVTLTPAAGIGSTFTGWSGACSGTGVCTVAMTAAKNVTATFAATSFTLTVTASSGGSITSTPPGINCFTSCTASFPTGTTVTLTAVPASGFLFSGWSGACSGTGLCVVTMNADKTVSALFVALPPPPPLPFLGVTVMGNGSVTSSPAGINCGATCIANFVSGATVILTAIPANGSAFSGWSGACSGAAGCVLTMNDNKTVTATFVPSPSTLVVSVVGRGTVTSSPPGINCGASCSASFPSGTMVTLTPTAGIGSAFTGWSGGCSGMGPCSMTMTTGKTVLATFTSNLASVSLNGAIFRGGQRVVYSADLTPAPSPTMVDVYLGCLLPDGVTFLSLVQSPGGGPIATVIGTSPVPYVRNALLTQTTVSVQYDFTGTEPAGTYTTYAAVTVAGTTPLVAANHLNLSVRAFQFIP